ncbi:hypothetical protein IFR05_006518 [Cadophora sp. M221]|nr:hypothetical protein IFR05_006518 [Cadophora sp. M221]
MDPSFYRNLTALRNKEADQAANATAQEQQANLMDQSSGSKNTGPDTNWTVYSPDASRGNLRVVENNVDDSDPRMRIKRLIIHTQIFHCLTRACILTFGWQLLSILVFLSGLHHLATGTGYLSLAAGGQVLGAPELFCQLIIGDGSAHLQTNYILQTYDNPPAHIVVKTHGWRTGPPEILAQLADPELADKVDPNSYKFRLFIDMETGDERYRDKVNCGMWVGSGMRKGAEVIYDAYRLS